MLCYAQRRFVSFALCRCGSDTAVTETARVLAWWAFGLDVVGSSWGVVMLGVTWRTSCNFGGHDDDGDNDYCDVADFLLLETQIMIVPIIVHTLLTFWIARMLGDRRP